MDQKSRRQSRSGRGGGSSEAGSEQGGKGKTEWKTRPVIKMSSQSESIKHFRK